MNMNDVITFANENSVTWLATCEDGIPHVRGMWMWFADETGFYFHTASIKSLAHQLEQCNAVEACFHWSNGQLGGSRMLRVNGKVEFVRDEKLEHRLFEERPWLLENRSRMPEGTEVRIFKIASGVCMFWDMSVNGRESEAERIVFPATC